MQVGTVLVIAPSNALALTEVEAAAGIISEMSGADEREIAASLRGGITFEVDGFVFAPDVVARLDRDERVSRKLSPVKRAPFPDGRKA